MTSDSYMIGTSSLWEAPWYLLSPFLLCSSYTDEHELVEATLTSGGRTVGGMEEAPFTFM